ncbi:MAG: asparagine synthase (glutamine-hydrolyzing), partial [Alphaproteobacteria bacterium]|nr:asparagine synthase (glutamine-hydrolyzing) [Alphaproteobacteria bacterium]
MCGIAGLISRDGAAPAGATLDALARALAHRGPDGQGRHVAGGVGLVHARLAIIDLATGDQPLFEPGGGALVGNGEIYNYIELRAAMATTNFRTRSDCEPPLLLHRHEGIGFARHLRGMYALAIHDAPSGRLTLSRDPFGIKPLYLAETPSGLAFASEPRALIAAGLVAPKARAGKARELLQLQFTTGAATIFEGIDRLLPGETVAIERGAIIERRRRAALPEGGPRDITEDAALAELDRVLVDSVAVHQRSDVPYGLFLSGGIDSATLLAIMARLNDRPVRAFTAAFPETAARDERALARTLARKVGAEHVEVEVREADFWAHLPAIAAAMDDPAADYAIVPTWLLAREAAKSLKVVLSGEGGDEIFGGYGRYRAAMRPRWLGGRAMRRKGALDGLGLLRDDAGWRAGFEVSESEAALSGRTRLQIAQAVDCADWLPNDLLIKLDRCLMAHALEGRTPFLDPVVADFAFR